MDGGALTTLRTGAASGAATAILARPESEAAAIIGAGRQGRATQLEAVCAVRPIRRASVFDPEAGAAERFADEMSEQAGHPGDSGGNGGRGGGGSRHRLHRHPVRHAVFDDTAVRSGTRAVGAYAPTAREIPGETVGQSRLVVDSQAACLEEAGDLLIPLGEGLIGPPDTWVEIGEIAAGAAPAAVGGRDHLFKSVGLAVQDAAAAAVALQGGRFPGARRPSRALNGCAPGGWTEAGAHAELNPPESRRG